MKKKLFFLVFTFLLVLGAKGQVTTSNIIGVVKDNDLEQVAGATITAVHVPSGTVYRTSANSSGRYNLANMRVGGPYKVEVSAIGKQTLTFEDVYLQLGQSFIIDPVFKGDTGIVLDEVLIEREKQNISSGTVTSISRKQIESLPSITRSVNDITRLTPQANGTAIGGGNYRSNIFTVDGANFSNQFGIGQNIPANGSPISLDALEQISVNVSPYDVRQAGFTGAAINAVTRSGNNEFFGSAFYTFRNENFQGDKVGDFMVNKNPMKNQQFGVSLGGPIIKDKLFFFVNGEFNPVDEPGQNRIASTPELQFGDGSEVARPTAEFLDGVRDYLINKYDYNPGEYQGYGFTSKNNKLLARIDWNISDKHKLNVRYNQVQARSPSFVSTSTSGSGISYTGDQNRRSINALHFSGSNYYQENNFYSGTIELNSRFGQLNNQLRLSYINQNEPRSSDSRAFPLVDIKEGDEVITTFGYEPFTYGNLREVSSYNINNEVSYVANQHSLVAGIEAEFSTIKNGFQRFGTGFYTFDSWDDFVNGNKPSNYALTFPMTEDGSQAFASFKFAQYSLYLQDEFTVNNRLRLMAGLRLELPTFPKVSEIKTHPLVAQNTYANGEKMDTGMLPSARVMFSPRIGFNYDVLGDRSLILRGGSGIFTGRVPFVWIVAQSGDAGMLQFTKVFQENELPDFNPDPKANYPSVLPEAGTEIPASVAALSKDFRFPQTWKSSLAIEYQLPYGVKMNIDGVFSKDINAAFARNINLADQHRLNVDGYGDDRLIYPSNRYINGNHNAIVMDSKTGGYYWSTTLQLEKEFQNGLNAMIAYTHSAAKNFGDGSGDQILNLWSLPQQGTGNTNSPGLGYTSNVIPDRIIANISYRQEWLKNLATTVSVFYQGGSQGRYSFTYNADLNNDGFSNDLIYVPKNRDEITFIDIPEGQSAYGGVAHSAEEQKDLFFSLVEKEKFLRNNKGGFAPRNGGKLPWRNQFDLRISQEVFKNLSGKRNTLQVYCDVFNLGNLLNKKWGHTNYVTNSSVLQIQNRNDIMADPSVEPVYRLGAANGSIIKDVVGTSQSISSTYYMQIGVRYSFQ